MIIVDANAAPGSHLRLAAAPATLHVVCFQHAKHVRACAAVLERNGHRIRCWLLFHDSRHNRTVGGRIPCRTPEPAA